MLFARSHSFEQKRKRPFAGKKKASADISLEEPPKSQTLVSETPVSQTVSSPEVKSAQPKPVSNQTANGNGISLNLKDIRAQVSSQTAAAPAVVEQTEETYIKVDVEKFTVAWNDYVENLKTRNKVSLMHSATKISPEYTEDGCVILKVNNESLKKLFNDDRTFLRDFLIQKHNISNVKIQFEVEEISEEEMKKFIFSDQDKLKRLYELNPAVAEMQRRLGLMIQ